MNANALFERARQLLGWYFISAIAMLALALLFGSRWTVPAQGSPTHTLMMGLGKLALVGFATSVALFLVSLAVQALDIMIGRAVRWVAGMIGATAIHAMALALLADRIT